MYEDQLRRTDEGWRIAARRENSADAYARSFARLCAGTVGQISSLLGPGRGEQLLDVGTGPGTIATVAARLGYSVVGLDRDDSMIDLAARGWPGGSFVRAALPHLPFRDQTFEVITANFVLNHTPDPRAAGRELSRVLAHGGRLAATIWTSDVMPLNQLWNEVMERAGVSPPPGSRLPARSRLRPDGRRLHRAADRSRLQRGRRAGAALGLRDRS